MSSKAAKIGLKLHMGKTKILTTVAASRGVLSWSRLKDKMSSDGLAMRWTAKEQMQIRKFLGGDDRHGAWAETTPFHKSVSKGCLQALRHGKGGWFRGQSRVNVALDGTMTLQELVENVP